MTTTDDSKQTLETRALRYLARREYSRRELEIKLSAYAHSTQVLADLLDKLEQNGYLSTERFAEQTRRTRRSRFGSQRIIHELKEKGVDEYIIANLSPDLKETDMEVAQQIWQKKFGAPPCDMKERSKQTRFLINRGFSPDTIREVLSQAEKENR